MASSSHAPTAPDGARARALSVEGISKQFEGLLALDSVSLKVAEGEILGLIGPNGSGKTTLVNVITGVLKASSGHVVVDGIETTRLPSHRIARAGIARTFQRVQLFRELTVLENVEVAAVSIGLSRREGERLARVLLAEVGLSEWSDWIAGQLPYGHERRVEIARALATRPKFLLLDEPAAGLNEAEGDELLAMLAPLPEAKRLGMLVIDHDMRLMMRLCHRLHVLNYGRTIGEGSPAEVRRIPAVIEAYLGAAVAETPGA
jgi:branched-chain amino acid transport system ATP-binding protein